MKYRSRIDIIAQILQTAMKGAPKSRLMCGAYLSYSQLQEYIEFMMQKELLIHEDGIYRLSPKGLHL
ncbi:MAG: winged helix-turn-helix domain-containing protein [Thaumarchaeota archaeon]|nr:winged helix-turn-helix domain-containing protein [Nitrososphaerota archaeon]